MTTKQTFAIISTFLILISCTKKQTDLEFEKSVANEIFPVLLDSVNVDKRLFFPPPPPPPPPNFDTKDTAQIKWDESKAMAEYKKRIAALKEDTTKLIVAIVDSTYKIDKSEKEEFIQFYEKFSIKLDTTFNNDPYKINISKLKHKEKIKLIYRSSLPKKNVWKPNYDFHLSGIIGFSRIQFDQTKKYGVLNMGFGCGGLCGFSAIVFIRKVGEKWIVDKIRVTAIS